MEHRNGPRWVSRYFFWKTSIGKSNTPLLRMHPGTVYFGEGLIFVLVLSKFRGPLGGGCLRGA